MAAKKTTKKPIKRAATKKPVRKGATVYYIRNLLNVHVSAQGDERRIELAARGQRRDTARLESGEKAELPDIGVLYEVITETEAKKVAEKQDTNITTGRHPAMDTIRNEHGEKYEQDQIKTDQQAFEDQGQKVADLKDGQVQIDRGVGIRRSIVPGTEDRPLPKVPDSIPPEEQADWLARQKNAEGPGAGIGDLRVVQEEVQKSD